MKLRYYLRGLGIGMLAAALILALFSNRGKETLSEQEIIKKAEALGMVKEEEVLFQPKKEAPPLETGEKASDAEELPREEETAEEQEEDSGQDTVSSNMPEEEQEDNKDFGQEEGNKAVPEDAVMQPVEDTAEDMEVAANGYEVRFRISEGTYGEKLALNLQKAGLVEDWIDFSEYLTSNGYSVKLMTGVYTIPLGSTYEQIAKTITSKSGGQAE